MSWPSIDHSLLSPSGHISKRARKAALAREHDRLFDQTEEHNEPTYANQLWHARKVLNEQGREALENPHAITGRECGCGECFCCAAVQVLSESTLSVGQAVTVRWTNCNRQYEGSGTIARVNAKTVRVRLVEPVPSQIGYEPYAAGWEIIVPVNGTAGNCVVVR